MIPGEPFGHNPPRYAATRRKSLQLPRSIEEDRNAAVGAFWGIIFSVVLVGLAFFFAIWVSTFFQTEPNIEPCTTEVGGYCVVEPLTVGG